MENAIRFEKPSEVRTAVVGLRDRRTVDQQRIDKFAEAQLRLPVDLC